MHKRMLDMVHIDCVLRHPRPTILAQMPTFLLLWGAPLLLLSIVSVTSAQGLIAVPPTLTPELGFYYLNKLRLTQPGIEFYSILLQRNSARVNAYVQVNNLLQTDTPKGAAAKSSSVRAVYTANTLGGKVTIESFYRLLRCEDDGCFGISRVVVAEVDNGPNNRTYPMIVVKSTMGNTSWLLGAPQGAVKILLDTAGERSYTDPLYKSFALYHKLVKRPAPCSSALPMTGAGALSEFFGLPGFSCIQYQNITVIVGASASSMAAVML
ncbi:hypothetical protein KFL_000330070 [Klebsormidium nitens]|uniref:Uncharacterized protein n=1 Tax=Klebsormidium nitens TaxID=105231 RepID=A0A1Y1HLR2_KLENI|nr:hypothetical protein KFL_000330070 [Klebsormidium nitens]|eukprot:GAQ79560.1 hypothetical protein KFL_000330070 [Klebsormidium nitens]